VPSDGKSWDTVLSWHSLVTAFLRSLVLALLSWSCYLETNIVQDTWQVMMHHLIDQLADMRQFCHSPSFVLVISVITLPQFHNLRPLFSMVWCVPATSAPVECIFSQSEIIMWLHWARMSDKQCWRCWCLRVMLVTIIDTLSTVLIRPDFLRKWYSNCYFVNEF